MSVRIRPNDDALVIRRVTPPAVIVHRYSACVWAETITLTAGSSRLAMSAIGLPTRLPAHPFRAAPVVWKPPSWMTRTIVLTPRRFEARHDAVRRIGLILEGEARHPGRRDDRRGTLEHLAEESDLEVLPALRPERLDPVGGEQRPPGGADDHVGRQILEVGARVDVGRTCGDRRRRRHRRRPDGRARTARRCSRRRGSRPAGCAAARPCPCRTRGSRRSRSRRSSGWRRS